MRNARLLVIGFVVLALGLASGCAKRQLTRSESDRLDAIAAKIAEAERVGAPDCIPYKEIAYAKVELEHARHEMLEYGGKDPSYYENDVRSAEKAADEALAKAKACQEAKKPPMAPPPPPPPVAPPPPVVAPPMKEEVTFQNIHFDFDKSFIRDDAKPILATVADYMKKHPDAKVKIEGHCDERGTSEYNFALGERRANSAKKYIADLGVDAARLSTISYGEERPLCTEHNEACWAKNRRAVFDLEK